jgi:hypothetical protein
VRRVFNHDTETPQAAFFAFEDIREANGLYVDKTARILDMIASLKNLYFL